MNQLPLFQQLPASPWIFDPLERGAYDVITADPAWEFLTRSDKGLKKSAQRHYKCMSLEEIQALPVAELAAPNCALFLWGTAPMLLKQIATMAAWGFEYKSHAVWVKMTARNKIAFGTGYRLRGSHEVILLGVRGNPKNTKSTRSALVAKRGLEHSEKPDAFFTMVEKWLPGARRVDLFSRLTRPGWDAWGDEMGKFDYRNQGDRDAVGSGQSLSARLQSTGEGVGELAP